MKDRSLLVIWMAAIVGITFIHDSALLAGLLAIAMMLAGRESARTLRRALVAVALVNVAVSLGYVLAASLAADPWSAFVLRLNLRVVLLAFLTLWLSRHVDLVRAVAFSPSMKFIVVLVLGQIQTFRRMLLDYRMAFRSRSPAAAPMRDRARGSGRQVAALLEKAEFQAAELNQGMQSRGFFDDRA